MSDRYDRQERLFGVEGQARLRAAHIVLFGTGGNGSHVVQQLSYAGVRNWTFVEFDIVEGTNLNRLIGAGPGDVGSRKVEIATRMVQSLRADAEPVEIVGRLGDPEIHDEITAALATATLVIGCFDRESPRLEAVKLCSKAGVPYLDLATEVIPGGDGEAPTYGGRVAFSHDGTGCLVCLDLIDMAELAREQMPESQQAEFSKMYGIDAEDIGVSGPSVVTINGVVASLACTEALMFLTDLREPARQLTYIGNTSTVRRNTSTGNPDCLYCHQWREKAPSRTGGQAATVPEVDTKVGP
jgi:molybdopterin-synthase adenylyltransferase